MKHTIPVLCCILLLTGCIEVNAPVSSQPQDKILIGAFDTTQIIAELNIIDNYENVSQLNENREGLNPKIDTLELTYYFGFCDCQSWIISHIHERAEKEHPGLNELDPRGQVQFNLDQHGYYIEPATDDLEIDWRTNVNGTKIRLIGREYNEKGYPENGNFTVPDPPKGKVFRYYSYEIIRPYFIWGPDAVYDINDATGETLTAPTILTVK